MGARARRPTARIWESILGNLVRVLSDERTSVSKWIMRESGCKGGRQSAVLACYPKAVVMNSRRQASILYRIARLSSGRSAPIPSASDLAW